MKRKIYVTLQDDTFPAIEAAELLPGTWNGWAQPRFTREQGLALVTAFKALPDAFAGYDVHTDTFVFVHTDCDRAERYRADTDGLYSIGTSGWTWDTAEAVVEPAPENAEAWARCVAAAKLTGQTVTLAHQATNQGGELYTVVDDDDDIVAESEDEDAAISAATKVLLETNHRVNG